MIKTLATVLTLASFGTGFASAATYYVAKTGSDSAAGTQSQPWATIQKGASTASAGDTVNIAAGTYSGTLTLSRSGSSSAPITFKGSSVILTGNIVFNGSYVTVSGVTCSPPSAGGYNAITIGGSNNILSGCTVTKYGAAASDQATAIGITGSNISVIDCVIRDLNDIDAFHIWGNNNLIQGCTISNLNQVNYSANHTDGFQSWGPQGSSNITIKDTIMVNSNCQIGNTETDGGSGLHDWNFINCIFANVNNTFFCGIPSTRFYNCVFYKCAGPGSPLDTPITFYGITNYSSAGSEVVNTVFLECGSSPSSSSQGTIGSNGANLGSLRIEKNYFGGTNYATKSGGFMGTSPINGGNPKFANAAALDFHLQSGSPLVDAGVALTSVKVDSDGVPRPAGSGYDVGAYELSSTIVVAAPSNASISVKVAN